MQRRPDAARALVPLALFAFALGVRVLPAPQVLTADGAWMIGHDAYYHLRRVAYGIAHFPATLDFDPYLNFPHGARAIWTPVFDWLSTCFALPFHAAAGTAGMEWAAALVPALLGAACVPVLYGLARRTFDEATAVVAGLLLAVLSGHVWYSQIGFFDHHAAVALAAVAMLAAGAALARAPTSLRASLALSASQAAGLLLWPGMLLHAALVELGIVWLAVRSGAPDATDGRNGERGEAMLRLRAPGHVLAFAIVAPFCLGQQWPQWGDFSPAVLSRFQPWLFAVLALHAFAGAHAWRALRGAGPLRRIAALAALGAALGGASLLLLPGLGEATGDAWRWLAKQERFQAQVSESTPILRRRGALTTELLARNLSWLGALMPLSLGALWLRARRLPQRGAVELVVIWSAGLLLATLQQRRFGNSAAIGTALISAWLVVRLGSRTTPSRVLWRAGLAVALVLALLPTLAPRLDPARANLAWLRGEPVPVDAYHRSKRSMLSAGHWLRDHETGGDDFHDLASVPDFGVMTPWHMGHRLLYSSELPMVVGNFGDDVGEANFAVHDVYFHSAEAAAARQLDRVRARFVVVESLTREAAERLDADNVLLRLTSTPPRGLAHHRLRYATPRPADAASVRHYRVFERVAGAQVAGRADPGATVLAQILVAGGGDDVMVDHVTTADADGRYAFTVAQGDQDAVRGGWRIRSGRLQRPLRVPLAAVLAGRDVAGPDMRGGLRGDGGAPAGSGAPGPETDALVPPPRAVEHEIGGA